MGRSRRPAKTPPPTDDTGEVLTPPPRPRTQSLDAAQRAVREAITRIRNEQARRGRSPSGEVQLALRAAQSAGHWLREAEEVDRGE